MHVQAKLTDDIENRNVSGSMHADLLELSSEDVNRIEKSLHCLQEKLAAIHGIPISKQSAFRQNILSGVDAAATSRRSRTTR